MLDELRVSHLGVIADAVLELGPGMTALTGETGAGKTLLIEALELLLGGRADATIVRPGAEEAIVEGRFTLNGSELVVARSVPAGGRSRAWVNARMAPVAALAEAAGGLVDLHGQHLHQSLLRRDAQRDALDSFAGIGAEVEAVAAARARVRAIEEELASLGGDVRAREREADVLRYQLAEIEAAGLDDPDEDARLEAEEEMLAEAAAHKDAAFTALTMLEGGEADDAQGCARDAMSAAIGALGARAAFASLASRISGAVAEMDDVAAELRGLAESLDEDPRRLDEVRARRRLIRELINKYGETIEDVLVFSRKAACRLDELVRAEETARKLEEELLVATREHDLAASALGSRRRSAASQFSARVQEHLRALAMPRAVLDVILAEEGPADDVGFLLAANPGEQLMPLAKVASGGELARVMLAIRLASSSGRGPATLVFDEVDAGIGGEAALAVGRALSKLASTHQVLVVTHLAQVAAYADHHALVTKFERHARTEASVAQVDGEERLAEISRMLSGQSRSAIAREHAKELLEMASGERTADRGAPHSNAGRGVGSGAATLAVQGDGKGAHRPLGS